MPIHGTSRSQRHSCVDLLFSLIWADKEEFFAAAFTDNDSKVGECVVFLDDECVAVFAEFVKVLIDRALALGPAASGVVVQTFCHFRFSCCWCSCPVFLWQAGPGREIPVPAFPGWSVEVGPGADSCVDFPLAAWVATVGPPQECLR